MSPDPHAEHEHGHHAAAELPHATMRDYLIGFVLSAILTAIPFWLVMTMPLSPALTAAVIMGFAMVQIVVHMVFFLHMNSKSEGGWTMLSLIFTITVVVIMLAGSLWVMHHLNTNMMPMPHDMSEMR